MKTNFIKNPKQFLFLIVTVLGTFISYSQPFQNLPVGVVITPSGDSIDTGGSKSSDVSLLNSWSIDKSLLVLFSNNVKAECTVVTVEDIGGKSTSGTGSDAGTGQYDDDSDPYDSGGKISPGYLGLLTIQNDTEHTITIDLSQKNLVSISLKYRSGIGCNLDTDLGGSGKGTSMGGGQQGNDDDDSSDRAREEYSFFCGI